MSCRIHFFQVALIFFLLWQMPFEIFAADSKSKKLRLEFNPVVGARAYEIEIISSTHSEVFKLSTPEWRGNLEPGPYKMRTRSFDHRNIPGEWSVTQFFEVPKEKLILRPPIKGEADSHFETAKEAPAPVSLVAPVASKTSKFDPDKNETETKDGNLCVSMCGIFGSAFPSVNYVSTNYDKTQGSKTRFTSVGASLRLGVVHQKADSPWEFHSSLESLHFGTDSVSNVTQFFAEVGLLRRIQISQARDFILSGGLFYKDDPVFIGDATSLTVNDNSKIVALGPWLGAGFEMQFQKKWSGQFLAKLGNGMVKLATPNGQKLGSNLLTHFEILFSYLWSENLVFKSGIEARNINLNYGSSSGGSSGLNNVEVKMNSLVLSVQSRF